ncbi:L-aminopeptidase DmpA [Scopulibacillus darangshiensis]|uniref:L-aminopeptidase DmpA n=1 Tax=Scopulibacillus darangshiensis TaxID=442528 RepID=A0A4R2NH03_9BACL|nr:P1 family peptidase [Scopulibacillus darangshiensis]TCP20637.1 L-aminopeptidase DmpA [Scopulibacillus darangshiensis]
MTKKIRARDLGLPFEGTTGVYNAITDVPGVEVGTTTIIQGDGPVKIGKGPIRTGVTAILPRGKQDTMNPIWAGFHSLNGNGEMTGMHWVNDGGYFLSPICLTNTHAVGTAHQATVKWMIEQYEEQFKHEHLWAMPVIAETYDGVLNDINGEHVQAEHVLSAIRSAKGGDVAEGNVGGGTGMICYEFKGGTGTSSRAVTIGSDTYHIGALVQANHGIRDWLTVLGVPVGKHMTDDKILQTERGSIIVVIGTDIPMLPHQLRRVAKRAAIGIGRNGTPGGNNSGDIFLAFSVANKMDILQISQEKLQMDFINDEFFDPIYEAACQAVEESVLNALVAAEAMTTAKPYGHTVKAIDHEELRQVMKKYNKL